MDVYGWADYLVNTCPKYESGFTQLLSTKPYRVSHAVRDAYDSRLVVIRDFQQRALNIFRAALKSDTDPIILHWLMNETPSCMGIDYHRSLEERHFTLPHFFRTDEGKPGKIIEINCPSALWGELQLLFDYTGKMGYNVGCASPAHQYASQLTELLNCTPVVHHFLDRSTSPSSWRYFIEKTRPFVKYWGIDNGIRISDCNFIRHQTFLDLWTDDNLFSRLEKTGKGLIFDFPPHVLFEQKATIALPFWSITRDSFSDEIRDLFPYTTPLLRTGIELPDGRCIPIEEFSGWPRSRRSYYLKLAGYSRLNFGSKAVYRLSNLSSQACLSFLQQCLREYENGQIWLLQEEVAQDDEIEYWTRENNVHTQALRAMFSAFYGPGGCIGVIVLHGGHYKVHGANATVLSYVLADTDIATFGDS